MHFGIFQVKPLDIPRVVSKMTSRDKKKTFQIRAQVAKTDSLRSLWGKLPSFYQDRLELNYEKIVHLLCVPVQIEAITCLAQFYDPPLCCFTFQDFQLAPTIEEFSQILRSSKVTKGSYKGISKVAKISELSTLLGIPNLATYYKTDIEVHGFNISHLEKIAQGMVGLKRWDNLVDLLALLIFGLVLFPNLDGFIDDASISVFWATKVLEEDYVPALLGDVYYTLELKYIKRKGMMFCCIPLLYQWFMAQIYLKSAIIPVMDRSEWSQKLVSLNKQSICWYAFKMGKDEVITSCGSFPNVPLIGSRGCISYNPILSLRQIGFPMFEKLEEEALQGVVLHDPAKEFALLSQMIKAWEKVHIKGSELRVRVGQRKESYKQWSRERVELVKLPFILNESSQVPPPEPSPPAISFEEANDLKARILQLEQEKEEVEVRLNKTTAEKNQLKWDLQQQETKFNALKEKYDQKKDKVKKVKTCLNQADSGLGSLHGKLEESQIETHRWGKLWNQAMKEKSVLRKGLEGRIQELTNFSRNPRFGQTKRLI